MARGSSSHKGSDKGFFIFMLVVVLLTAFFVAQNYLVQAKGASGGTRVYAPDQPGTSRDTKNGTGTENGSTETGEEKDAAQTVTAEVLKDDHGRVTFWEWKKVTQDNFAQIFTGQNSQLSDNDYDHQILSLDEKYYASMFVAWKGDTPIGFLSSYADSDHVFNGIGKDGTICPEFPALGKGDQAAQDAALKTLTSSPYLTAGTPSNPGNLDLYNSVFLKMDSQGLSLDPSNFKKDRFFTSGSSMGVFWVDPMALNHFFLHCTTTDEGLFSSTERTVYRIDNATSVSANIALSRPSMKSSGDMSYNSIGKNLNGNKDYFLMGDWATTNLKSNGPFKQEKAKDGRYWVPRYTATSGSGMPYYGYDMPSRSMKVLAGREISFEAPAIMSYGTEKDKWTIASQFTQYEASYLCYHDGWLVTVPGGYWKEAAGVGWNGGYNAGNAIRQLQPQDEKNGYYGAFTWYVGTPHVFASVLGEGGDAQSGEGGVTTIPSGKVYIVSGAKYLDDQGNEATSEGVVLPEGSSIVIEEGGVLSVEGNFLMNGEIINKGGTIIIKDGGCISPFGDTKQGTIDCSASKNGRSGDIIIMPGGKLFCLTNEESYGGNLLQKTEKQSDKTVAGGFQLRVGTIDLTNGKKAGSGSIDTAKLNERITPALRLCEGSTVINYGTLVTSYMKMDSGCKVENRQKARFFAGYNRTDKYALLYNSAVTDTSVEKIAFVDTYAKDLTAPPVGIRSFGSTMVLDYLTKNLIKGARGWGERKGTVITESTAAFHHSDGTVDHAANAVIKTPEY